MADDNRRKVLSGSPRSSAYFARRLHSVACGILALRDALVPIRLFAL